jgi:hypothetical protein
MSAARNKKKRPPHKSKRTVTSPEGINGRTVKISLQAARTVELSVMTDDHDRPYIFKVESKGQNDPDFTYDEAQGVRFYPPLRQELIKFAMGKIAYTVVATAIKKVLFKDDAGQNQFLVLRTRPGPEFWLEGEMKAKVVDLLSQKGLHTLISPDAPTLPPSSMDAIDQVAVKRLRRTIAVEDPKKGYHLSFYRMDSIGPNDPDFTYDEVQRIVPSLPPSVPVVKFAIGKSAFFVPVPALKEVKVVGNTRAGGEIVLRTHLGPEFRLYGEMAERVLVFLQVIRLLILPPAIWSPSFN